MVVRINETDYPVIEVSACSNDVSWDGRMSKTIYLEMDYADAVELFVDDIEWELIFPETNPDTNETTVFEFDNSAYNIAGDIIDHRDGTLSIKMGKETDLEEAYELLYGGE